MNFFHKKKTMYKCILYRNSTARQSILLRCYISYVLVVVDMRRLLVFLDLFGGPKRITENQLRTSNLCAHKRNGLYYTHEKTSQVNKHGEWKYFFCELGSRKFELCNTILLLVSARSIERLQYRICRTTVRASHC